MNIYTIGTPIWNGEEREPSIGIAEFRLPTLLEITYKDKHDNRLYPDMYIIHKNFAEKYPSQFIGKFLLRIIPIKDLEIYK